MRTRIGSDQARLWVRSLRLGNPYAKAILMAVANYVNEDGTAYPGIATLHLDTEIAENTITARLRWCEAIGAVTLAKCWVDENGRRNRDGRGRTTSQEIRFLLDVDVEAIAEAARQHTTERPLRGIAKQNADDTEPSSDDDLTPQVNPPSGGELNPVSPSLAPQQPLTGGPRIEEEEKEERKIPTPTPSKLEGALKNQPQVSEATRQRFQEFKSAYPDGIVDLDKAEKEFLGIPDADQEACVTAAPVYAARCRKRREKSKKAHLFIRERAWVGLLASTASVDGAPRVTSHSPHSEAGKALITLSVIAVTSLFRLPNGNISYVQPVTPQLLALANVPPESDWIEREIGSQEFAAWRGLIYRIFAGRTLREMTKYRVPWRWPPAVDGKTYAGTDPPPGELSDADAQALMT